MKSQIWLFLSSTGYALPDIPKCIALLTHMIINKVSLYFKNSFPFRVNT